MVNIDEVVAVLRQCKDPELNANIVDIGLIQGIQIKEGKDVKVKLTMTSPMCPVTSLIMADVQLRLQTMPSIGNVEVELSWEPLWSPDMMSDELRYRL